ncbi:unnamed protein product, partial [Cylicocyclus nassatus]
KKDDGTSREAYNDAQKDTDAKFDSRLQTSSRPHPQYEKEQRRERGEMLLRLYRENPLLIDTANARTMQKNKERAQLWEKITQQINEAFEGKLEVLSVEKTKKLLTYYKKRDDGSYEKLGYPNAVSQSPSSSESVSSEHGGFEEDDRTVSLNERNEIDQHSREYTESLASPTSYTSVVKSESPPTPELPETFPGLKKERHDFVVAIADHYLDRMCFDNSSRSTQINAERHNMWVKITHITNQKYGGILSPLGVEQTKKLFSNCKRRRRMRSESSSEDWSFENSVSFQPTSSAHATSSSEAVPSSDSSYEENFGPVLQQLMNGFDLRAEIVDLRRQLADCEAEVTRLQQVIVKQAEDYKARISAVAEILKFTADKQFAEDIRKFLGLV